jgi:hypothetical protein
MPSLPRDRQQDRHQDRDRRGRLEEAADEQHQQVGQQQEDPGLLGEAQHPGGDGRGDAGGGEHPAEDRRRATMNITVAVVSTVSRQTLTNIFQLSVRYQARPRNIAHTQAAMAPSVGVNSRWSCRRSAAPAS